MYKYFADDCVSSSSYDDALALTLMMHHDKKLGAADALVLLRKRHMLDRPEDASSISELVQEEVFSSVLLNDDLRAVKNWALGQEIAKAKDNVEMKGAVDMTSKFYKRHRPDGMSKKLGKPKPLQLCQQQNQPEIVGEGKSWKATTQLFCERRARLKARSMLRLPADVSGSSTKGSAREQYLGQSGVSLLRSSLR